MRAFRGIFFKLFSVSLGVTIVLFALLMFSVGVRARRLLVDQEIAHSQVLIARNDEYMDLYLQNLTNLLLMIGEVAEIGGTDVDRMQLLLEGVAENNPATLGRVYFVREDGTAIASNRLVYDIVGHPGLSAIVGIVDSSDEGLVLSEPYRSPQLAGRTVAFARNVGREDGSRLGVLIAEINLEHLTGVLEDIISQDYQTFAVLTSLGNVVTMERSSTLLPYQPRVLPRRIQEEFVTLLRDAPKGIGTVTYQSQVLTSVKSTSNHLGWEFIVLIEDGVFRERVSALYGFYLRIGLVILALTVFTTYWLSKHFSDPIHELALAMDRMNAPEQLSFEPVDRDDEIGTLYVSFDRLLNRVRELLEAQRRAEENKRRMEIKILQSQIKPHFLGNTLACIASLAKQKRSEEAEEMIRALILLLTSSIDKLDELVSLEEELRCVDAYVRLQKMRYGSRFEYYDQVEAGARNCVVPKLLLEPIIENSIFHGFSDRTGGNVIRATGRRRNGTLEIEVEDDGVGMDSACLQALSRRLENATVSGTVQEEGRYSSIGLKNVADRIRLLFGDSYGLTVHSAHGKGTRVVVRIPGMTSDEVEK
jgi:sensor histidine kinase YesM